MTKEELTQEAKEWCKSRNFTPSNVGYFASDYCEQSYIAGAESREKQIVELKAEIQNLEGIKLAQETALSKEYLIEEQLRKENAKLKADYEVLSCSVGDFGELQDKFEEEQRKNNVLSDNLTKAKEIISELLSSCFGYNSKTVNYEVKAKAEQFLKSGANIIKEDAQAGNSPFDADKVFNKEMKAYPEQFLSEVEK